MPAVRILVASDRIGALSSRRAGEAIASGWPEAEVRVYPVGEAGGGFVEAFADASGTRAHSVADAAGVMTATVASPPAAGSVDAPVAPVDLASSRSAVSWEPAMASADPLPDGETSVPLGRAVRRALEERASVLYVDLAGPVVHDAGAGFLSALGAVGDVPLDRGAMPLATLTDLDLQAARTLLADTELVGVVPSPELRGLLLGLRGITSRLGRDHDVDPARMLAVDAALERFASLAAPQQATAPGSGACGGLGFADPRARRPSDDRTQRDLGHSARRATARSGAHRVRRLRLRPTRRRSGCGSRSAGDRRPGPVRAARRRVVRRSAGDARDGYRSRVRDTYGRRAGRLVRLGRQPDRSRAAGRPGRANLALVMALFAPAQLPGFTGRAPHGWSKHPLQTVPRPSSRRLGAAERGYVSPAEATMLERELLGRRTSALDWVRRE